MSDEFDYDVFISYSSRDKAWVRGELLTRIEQAGLRGSSTSATSHAAPPASRSASVAFLSVARRSPSSHRNTLRATGLNLRTSWCKRSTQQTGVFA